MVKINRAWRGTVRSFDSKWEQKLTEGVLKDHEYHPDIKIGYTVHHHYKPDFRVLLNNKTLLVEAKGRFIDTEDASRYIWIRECLPPNHELVFLFYNPETPMPRARRRKDGTRYTVREFAEKYGFRWYTETTIKEIL